MKNFIQRLKTHASAAVVAIAAIGASSALTNQAEAATFDWDEGTVTVESGDLLSTISGRQLQAQGLNSVDFMLFGRANNMTRAQADLIFPGQVLQIPAEIVAAYEAAHPAAVEVAQAEPAPAVVAQGAHMAELDAAQEAALAAVAARNLTAEITAAMLSRNGAQLSFGLTSATPIDYTNPNLSFAAFAVQDDAAAPMQAVFETTGQELAAMAEVANADETPLVINVDAPAPAPETAATATPDEVAAEPEAPAVNPVTAAQEAVAAHEAAEAEAETARLAAEEADANKERVLAAAQAAQEELDAATAALDAAQAAHDQAVADGIDATATQAALEAAQEAKTQADIALTGANDAYAFVESEARDMHAAADAAQERAEAAAQEAARLSVTAVSEITDPQVCIAPIEPVDADIAPAPAQNCQEVTVEEDPEASAALGAWYDAQNAERDADIEAAQQELAAAQQEINALVAAHDAEGLEEAAMYTVIEENCDNEALLQRVRDQITAAAAARQAEIDAKRAAVETRQTEIDALIAADQAAEAEAAETLVMICDEGCEPPEVVPPTEEIEAEACGLVQTLLNHGHNTGRLYDWQEVFNDPRNAHLFPTGNPNLMLEGELIVDQADGNYEVVEIDPSKVVDRCLPPPPPRATTLQGTTTSSITIQGETTPQQCSVSVYRDGISEFFGGSAYGAVKTRNPAGSYECCVSEELPLGAGGEDIWVRKAPFCPTGGGDRDPTRSNNGHHGGCGDDGSCGGNGGNGGEDRDPVGGGPGNPGGEAGADEANGTRRSDASTVLGVDINRAFALLDVPAETPARGMPRPQALAPTATI